MDSISVLVRTSCGSCGGSLPLNAMTPRLACPACGAKTRLGDEFWQGLLGDPDLGSATVYTAGRQVALEIGSRSPACHGCGAAIDPDVALARADQGSMACGCGERVLLRAPDLPWVVTGFRLLVGEDESQLPGPRGRRVAAPGAAAQPIAFNCPLCGGVLRVDGSSRMVTCEYCAGTAYLPNDLWAALHPAPRARTWYLLREKDAWRQARKEAEDPATAPERLDALSHHLDASVREAVAAHPRTPPATLARLLAEDESFATAALDNPALPPELWSVLISAGKGWILESIARSERAPAEALRAVAAALSRRLRDEAGASAGDEDFGVPEAAAALRALAENGRTPAEVLSLLHDLDASLPSDDREELDELLVGHPLAPPELLVRLAGSEDDSVREAVAAHPAAPLEALERLSRDPEWTVREAVARRPGAVPELLRRLARDEDSGVREAARENPAYPRFSLLRALFGG